MNDFFTDPRFAGMEPFKSKIWLSSPTMHGDEQRWVDEAIQSNWVSTVGANINEIEAQAAAYIGCRHAVALSSGTAALHLAVRLAGERLYGSASPRQGALKGRRVFCSDMTFDATVNPVSYEGGECVFIDTGETDWNMDPEALETAFGLYPDTKLIVLAHLYGTPSTHMEEIRKIADRYGALIVEDAAESLGASIFTPVFQAAVQETPGKVPGSFAAAAPEMPEKVPGTFAAAKGIWRQTGTFGDYAVISFNGNKVITGSSGGMLLTDNARDARKARKWSTQAREDAPWYQHEELGYNYRMSNIVAGIVRGQMPYLEAHISSKRQIWERYRRGLEDLPVTMNPIPPNVRANYWLSCMAVNKAAMCPQVRSEHESLYYTEPGKSCPDEILAALKWANCEGRPIWKPMHMQPIYRNNPFITRDGPGRGRTDAYITGKAAMDVGADIFQRGLCLPSDNKMTEDEQETVIEIVRRCFR